MTQIEKMLGEECDHLLGFDKPKISKDQLHVPGPDWIERVVEVSDRPNSVLRNMQLLLNNGRLGSTGYLSILPVDQGVEHSAGASFAPNPAYFDSENIVKLALEAGCNAVASTLGVLGSVSRRYAHRIPFIVKLNHNETLSYPNKYDQVLFASARQAFNMGAVAVGATVYGGHRAQVSRKQLGPLVAVRRARVDAAGLVDGPEGIAPLLGVPDGESVIDENFDLVVRVLVDRTPAHGEQFHQVLGVLALGGDLGVVLQYPLTSPNPQPRPCLRTHSL